jgi:hypothetical protein
MLLQSDGGADGGGSEGSFAVGARVRLGEGIAGRVAASREPLMVHGALADRAAPRAVRADTPEESAMSVPLVHREAMVGVLNVNARAGRDYTLHDLRALGIFGEQAAAAIAHARLYEAQRLGLAFHHALHDALTGLPNRALLLDRAHQAVRRWRGADERVAMMFSTSTTSRSSTTLGHTVGDRPGRLRRARGRRFAPATRWRAWRRRVRGVDGGRRSEHEALQAADRIVVASMPPLPLVTGR